ncbi:MAG: DUF2577 domain-containing protein [Acidaminococcaceae bacterium]|nr:DUF2577 domain-containing protein [Acidaminococcaceae bacterium]
MSDINLKLYQAMQEVIGQNVDSMRLGDFVVGTVETASPLSIRVTQKDLITEEFLQLTDLVRDFDVDIEVDHNTEDASGGSGDSAYAPHHHGYKGRKKITVYNGLHVGEVVLMGRAAGGQTYYVISRLANHTDLSGQWV